MMTQKQTLSFDDVKKIIMQSIDEADTPVDLMRIIAEKVYEKGVDGVNQKGEQRQHSLEHFQL